MLAANDGRSDDVLMLMMRPVASIFSVSCSKFRWCIFVSIGISSSGRVSKHSTGELSSPLSANLNDLDFSLSCYRHILDWIGKRVFRNFKSGYPQAVAK